MKLRDHLKIRSRNLEDFNFKFLQINESNNTTYTCAQ